jgi:phosphatidylinositol alpha-1,6-mannosyltransferase
MNILVTANCFLPGMGGTEVYSYDLAIGLSRQLGTNVQVLAPYSKGCQSWDADCPLEIVRYRSRCKMIFYFFKILLSKKIDKVYVTHRAHFLSLAIIAYRLLRIPFWVTLHGTEYFGPDKAACIIRKLRKARKVIVTSNFVKSQAMSFGVPEHLLSLIPPSLDTERFHPEIDSEQLEKNLRLNGEKVLVTLARLVPQKRIDHVIEALARVRDRLPPFRYFILGRGSEEKKLKSLVRERGLEEQVIFTGMVPHHELTSADGAYLSLADIFILTSVGEAFGIVYLEAGACGKPVVAYDSGGVVDIVDHEKTGLLVPPGDIDAVGNGIVRLFNDPELIAHMGSNARERIVTHFNHQAVNQRIWHLLKLNEI